MDKTVAMAHAKLQERQHCPEQDIVTLCALVEVGLPGKSPGDLAFQATFLPPHSVTKFSQSPKTALFWSGGSLAASHRSQVS
jgi:hypothetical protein